MQVAETSSSTPVENTQGYYDRSSMLLVPLDTKIDETNLKAHVIQMYPHRTIMNGVVHLDVKPGVIPFVCSPQGVSGTFRDSLKEELDRMESIKVIRK